MSGVVIPNSGSDSSEDNVFGRLHAGLPANREWYAAFTLPNSERAVVRHLDAHHVESFLPTFEATHVWKNRQKKKVIQPLFPGYVFVHVMKEERKFVFQAPGLLRLVGNARGPIPISSSEIDVLRSETCRGRLEPFPEFAPGERVRIKSGPMQGVEGTLVRRKNGMRLVLSISLVHQHAALEILGQDVEPVGD